MRFALVGTEQVEASPGLRGACRGCGEIVIAHCGEQRVWHWKHLWKARCSRWSEPETEWHRHWKNRFPREWQEARHRDEKNDEIHVADILTAHGCVIEFQHSRLHPDERTARETFYENLVWVVNATRLKRDFPRFRQGFEDYFRQTTTGGFFFVSFPEECFPKDWIGSRVPVIFDFKGLGATDPQEPLREALWCLLPEVAGTRTLVVGMSVDDLVKTLSSRAHLFPPQESVSAPAPSVQQPVATSAAPRVSTPRRKGPRRL